MLGDDALGSETRVGQLRFEDWSIVKTPKKQGP